MARPVFATLTAAALLCACSEPPQPPLFTNPVPLSMPSGPNVEGPQLSSGPGTPLLLSWMSRQDQGGELLFSRLDGDQWGTAQSVVSDPRMFVNWADVPQIVPRNQQDWLVHWLSRSGEASHAYDIKLASSNDAGQTWQPLGSPHDDGTQSEHGFVSSAVNGDQTRFVWLDGRNTANGEGMTLRTGVFAPASTEMADEQIDELVCDCCRTDIATNDNGHIRGLSGSIRK